MSKTQTWAIDLDESRDEIRYKTRTDDKVRQTFKVEELPAAIRDWLALRGVKVTMEERISDVPRSDVQGAMDARQAVWAMWCAGQRNKVRRGGIRTVPVAVQALADVKGASIAAVQKALGELDEDARRRVLSSDAVKARIAEIEDEAQDATDLDLSDLA